MPLLRLATSALLSLTLLTGMSAGAQPLQLQGLPALPGSPAPHQDVLSADQAFVLEAPALSAIPTKNDPLQFHWKIAPGYYLYRDQLQLLNALGQPLKLQIPEGQTLSDAFFGTVQVFHDTLKIQAERPQHPEQWPLQLQWQGCAHLGVCYPPQTQSITAQQLGLNHPHPSLPGLLQSLVLPPSITIGSLALPTMTLIVFAALLVSQWWARRQQQTGGQPAQRLLLHATCAGLLMARLAYVGQWWREYLTPLPAGLLHSIDIRDGGWNLWAGLLAAAVWILWRSHSHAALRRGALQAFAAGALILIAGHVMLAWAEPQKQPIPTVSLVNASAQTVNLRGLQGQPIVINLWASWCPPCRREMPVLMQAQKDHPELRFVWINQGEDAQTVLRYLQSMPVPADQVLLDPQQRVSQQLSQRGLPATYFYDAQGQLRSMRMGELSRATLAEHLAQLRPAIR